MSEKNEGDAQPLSRSTTTPATPTPETVAARGFMQRHKRSLSVALLTGIRLPRPKPTLEVVFGISGIQGRRQTMEDTHICIPATETPDLPLDAFFGVYDGHGGQRCADYIAANLHKNIMSSEHFKKGEIQAALRDGIYRTETEFLAMAMANQVHDGSTAVVAMIHDNILTVGNVGDSEAVLSRNGAPLVLSTIHNLKKNPHEAERVKAAGGRVWNHRVAHPCFNPAVMSIAVSRAFGDLGYKAPEFTRNQPSGLICEPDMMTLEIGPEDRFLLMACDGLWDVMTYEAAVEFVLKGLDEEKKTPQTICENLADWALAHGSQDNITVMLLDFVLHTEPEWQATAPALSRSADLLERVKTPVDRKSPREDLDEERLLAHIRFLEEENKNKDARIQELQSATHRPTSTRADAATATSPVASPPPPTVDSPTEVSDSPVPVADPEAEASVVGHAAVTEHAFPAKPEP